ncbi:hypothetical protein J7I98_02060 [Streptomyces sp. ISL-98]|uniref:hypothetical protein n=1 Tax=Streptomyces sp. ISL-98 TaxID=2819192 RepID=UPI001BE5CD76|nr:hypothetical protein [Streptomyces sp. ISL-98]MBT2504698.1 hypothetical protein [Streptomyces sp. ISL-98]
MNTEGPEKDAVGARERRSPLVAASVAAAVLLAGGGGAYWASTAGDGGGSGSGTKSGSGAPGANGSPPPLALDGYTDGSSRGVAPGEPDPNGVVYRAEGKLPDGPDSAPVYRASGAITEAEVARLAKALGVAGKPRIEGGAWKVGVTKDGAGPVLQVNKQAPGTWNFAQYGPGGGDNCEKGKPCRDAAFGPGGGGQPVSEKAAKEAAAPVLKALGQDDAKLDARQLMGAVRVVNADPEVGGLPTYGWATGLQIGSDSQLVGGSGQLKGLTKGAEYPVIGADEALKQLNKAGEAAGRIGIGGCATPVPHGDNPDNKPAKQDDRAQAPCEPGAGKVPDAPDPVTVGRATFGLAAQYVGGRQALVPSWLFEVKPGGDAQPFTITHPAVDPDYLVKPSVPPKESAPPESDTDTPSMRHVQSYAADGRELTVHFWGGACSTYDAKANEENGVVKVKIVETNPDPERVCILIAKELSDKVTLDKPLDGRKVVDQRSGETVPKK